ncbi:Vanadium-dependent bromoperoxidase [Nymphon striatum]|nr:Vanadium-dependent bromoperoxidase [Nymphon striatum]
MDWSEVAPDVRAALEHQLGAPVVSWSSQEEGFSPGMAARCMLENGSRAFVKAVNGATDEHARLFGLNELHVHKGLPVGAPAPRLLASVTDDDWVAGAWQDIDGRLPGSPWSESDLRLVFATLDGLRLEPAEGMSHLADRDMSLSGWRKLREQGRSDIEPWIDASVTNTLAEMESTWTQACPPDAFVHGDIRADNLLIDDDDQVWIVDWAHAMAGPAWFDHIAMIPSIAMQSGRSAADLWAMSAYATTVEPTAVDAVVAAVAGFLTEAARQPPLAVIPILVRLVQVLRGDQRVGRSRIGHFALVQIDRVDWKRGRDRSAEHADHGWIAKWSAFEPGDREVPGEVALAGFAYIAKRGGDGCSHVFQPGDGKHDDARSEQADFGAQAHLCSRRVECLECRERFMPLAVTQKAHRDVPLAALGVAHASEWLGRQTSEERLGFFLGGTAASIFDSDVAEDLLYVRTAPLPRSANDEGRSVADGLIEYGAQTIDQRVRRAEPANFMNTWDDWFDIQCALEPPIRERYQGRRFITTGRDLATYVHSDALYQPYLNASLVLFSQGIGLDTDMPFGQKDADDHQQGFVLFGPNHVLSLLAEVCTRGFKAVKYQKFNVHRRQRPEQLGARIERAGQLRIPELDTVAEAIEASPIAERIRSMNQAQTGQASLLLPMAYPEGAPMHPSYGAGHGTIAGACTTVLKALFDHTQPFQAAGSADQAFVPTADGNALETVRVLDESGRQVGLTVEGELNKLAANIAIARNWAGVHYFSDYWESVLFGEQIALAILREQMLAIPNDFTLTVPLFDGTTATVSR